MQTFKFKDHCSSHSNCNSRKKIHSPVKRTICIAVQFLPKNWCSALEVDFRYCCQLAFFHFASSPFFAIDLPFRYLSVYSNSSSFPLLFRLAHQKSMLPLLQLPIKSKYTHSDFKKLSYGIICSGPNNFLFVSHQIRFILSKAAERKKCSHFRRAQTQTHSHKYV